MNNPCPHCSHLKVQGTYVPTRYDDRSKPYRVHATLKGTAINFGDFETLEMAQAGACGTSAVRIIKQERELDE